MTDVRIVATDRIPDVLAVFVGESGPWLDGIAADVLPPAARTSVEMFLNGGDPAARAVNAGEVRALPMPGRLPGRILTVGVAGGRPADLRLAGAALGREARSGTLTVALPGCSGHALAAFAEGVLLGGYRFEVKSKPSAPGGDVEIAGADDGAAVERGRVYGRGAAWARELANT